VLSFGSIFVSSSSLLLLSHSVHCLRNITIVILHQTAKYTSAVLCTFIID
jgi:hypothetical protein